MTRMITLLAVLICLATGSALAYLSPMMVGGKKSVSVDVPTGVAPLSASVADNVSAGAPVALLSCSTSNGSNNGCTFQVTDPQGYLTVSGSTLQTTGTAMTDGTYSNITLQACKNGVCFPFTSSIPSVTVPTATATAYTVSGLNTSVIAKNAFATSGNTQYLCYYNTSSPPTPQFLIRNLTTNVFTAAPASGLPAAPISDDEHGNCAIAIDTGGILHVSYGQHGSASGLVYYRSNSPVTTTTVGGPFTKHSMVAANTGVVETSVTYPFFIKNPTTGALYFTFRYFGSGNGNQYFYSYNVGTSTWSAAAGTAACASQGVGCLINDMANSPTTSPYLNGLPKWDAAGKLWFNWQEFNGATSLYHNAYLVAWNGSTFQDVTGTAVTTPIVGSSYTPIVTIAESTQLIGQNDFTINNGVFYIPYSRQDGAGHWQIYVAESSIGAFVEHALTANTVNAPATCGSSPTNQQCALAIGVTALGDSNGAVYVVYTDDVNAPLSNGGVRAAKSTNNFTSFTTQTLISRYLPNFSLNTDPTRVSNDVSFMVMDAQDYQYGYWSGSTPSYGP